MIKKIVDWLKRSNRWKHLVGGYGIGVFSDDWYCALYSGAGIGAAMEFKDWQHGSKWDNVDLALTFAGAVLGQATRQVIWIIVGK